VRDTLSELGPQIYDLTNRFVFEFWCVALTAHMDFLLRSEFVETQTLKTQPDESYKLAGT